jgi:hypothetical protein
MSNQQASRSSENQLIGSITTEPVVVDWQSTQQAMAIFEVFPIMDWTHSRLAYDEFVWRVFVFAKQAHLLSGTAFLMFSTSMTLKLATPWPSVLETYSLFLVTQMPHLASLPSSLRWSLE